MAVSWCPLALSVFPECADVLMGIKHTESTITNNRRIILFLFFIMILLLDLANQQAGNAKNMALLQVLVSDGLRGVLRVDRN